MNSITRPAAMLRTTLRTAPRSNRTITNLAPRRSPHGRGEPGMGENPTNPPGHPPGGQQPMKRSNNGLKVATAMGIGVGTVWYFNRSRGMKQTRNKTSPAA